MRKLLIVIIILTLTPIFYVVAKHFWRGETMSMSKVCMRWGEAPLNVSNFKKASNDESVRAKMTCSLLKEQKKFFGKDRTEIRAMFGNYDGHYFSDMFPTYIIESSRQKGEDTWQIVFLIDRNEKISEIIVHKNCCD